MLWAKSEKGNRVESADLQRVIVPVVLLLGLSASSAYAGRIFGDIKMDGKPLPGIPVRITVPIAGEAAKSEGAKGEAAELEAAKLEAAKLEAAKLEAGKDEASKGESATGETSKGKEKPKVAIADSTVTDKFGSYKLNLKDEGKCTLMVVYEKQPVSIEVFSYEEATRYDLVLEKKDGKLALRRK